VDYEDIIFDIQDGIARLTINRPERRNALREQTFTELTEAIEVVEDDERVGVIVLTGAGEKAFCAGGDLEMAAKLTTTAAVREHYVRRMMRLSDAVVTASKPIICAVDGACIGGGAELVTFCDYVFATERSHFAFSGTDIGGSAWWGAAQLLPLMVGMRKADDILLSSRRVDAKEAVEIGLITRVVPTGKLDVAVAEQCDALLRVSAEGIRQTKAALRATKETLLRTMSTSVEMAIASHTGSDVLAALDAVKSGNRIDWRKRRGLG
jgi:enoyl-CoA hydratase/carnithine racemase